MKKVLDSIVEARSLEITSDVLLKKWEEMDILNVQQPYKSYKEIMALSLKQAFEVLRLPYFSEDGEALVHSLESWKPFPDVKSSLDLLRTKFRLGVISNIDNDLFENSLRQLGTAFDFVLTAERARVYKPNGAIFQQALRELDRQPQEVLHASFSYQYDLDTAAALGFRTALVRRSPIVGGKADYIAADLKAFAELFHTSGRLPTER